MLVCSLSVGLAISAGGGTQGDGNVTVDSTVSDHCVLLGNAVNVVKGTAKAGCTVTVTFGGSTHAGTTDASGNYRVSFDPGGANSSGRVLTVSDGVATKTVSDVLVGEVWYVSGQSNVAIPMSHQEYVGKVDEWMTDIDYPLIRMAIAPASAKDPIVWQQVTSANRANVLKMPPLPFFFAKELHKGKGVPVGITVASVGATAIGQWMSAEAIAVAKAENPACSSYGKYTSEYDTARARRFDHVAARAALWYQGEADGMWGYDNVYAANLRALINDWRTRRGAPGFPVVIPNLAFCKDYTGWIPVSIAQEEVARTMANVVCVPQPDLGYNTARGAYAVSQHPDDKDLLGKRLYAAARNLVYGESDVLYRCPCPQSATYDGNVTVVVKFPDTVRLVQREDSRGYAATPFRVVTAKGTKMTIEENAVSIGADGHSLVYTMGWKTTPASVSLYLNQNAGAFNVKLYDGNGFPVPAFSLAPTTGDDPQPQHRTSGASVMLY